MLCFQYVGIILDFIVWARHMFAAGLDIDTKKAYFTAVLSVICSSLSTSFSLPCSLES